MSDELLVHHPITAKFKKLPSTNLSQDIVKTKQTKIFSDDSEIPTAESKELHIEHEITYYNTQCYLYDKAVSLNQEEGFEEDKESNL